MKKKLLTLLLAGILALSSAVTSFAGQWKQDTTGWWYENDDASYLKDGWNWVDGKCYYFTPDGYCLINTTTPDGYTVDASGAWIVDGVVQTQAPATQTQQPISQSAILIDTLTFTPPEGFIFEQSDENTSSFVNQSDTIAIAIGSQVIGDWDETQVAVGEALQKPIIELSLIAAFGEPESSETKQYTSGTWYRYRYASGALEICARIHGNRIQMVMVAGDLSGFDIDSMMNNNLK